MRCPHCAHEDSKVTDSRAAESGIRRRRECLRCNKRFTTYERVQSAAVQVIKRDERREEFNREKLASSIRKASGKRPSAGQRHRQTGRRSRGRGAASWPRGDLVLADRRDGHGTAQRLSIEWPTSGSPRCTATLPISTTSATRSNRSWRHGRAGPPPRSSPCCRERSRCRARRGAVHGGLEERGSPRWRRGRPRRRPIPRRPAAPGLRRTGKRPGPPLLGPGSLVGVTRPPCECWT